ISLDGDVLEVEAPAPLSSMLIEQLRHAKPLLLKLLRHSESDSGSSPGDDFEERAAIIEHGAGVPREWAEGAAMLDPNRPASDVAAKRWWQFVDDVGRFLDDGWAQHAAALGWGPADLFGCHPRKPIARIDRQGLLWLLYGRRLLALTADTAVIETPT